MHMPKSLLQITFVFTWLFAQMLARGSVLASPADWQVAQRNAEGWAEVKVAGTVPTEAGLVEVKAEVIPGSRGKPTEWTIIASGSQITDGKFRGSVKLSAGGWYQFKVRCRKSGGDSAVLDEVAVEHVGVGEVFVIAGQSNSSNHGAEKQKTTTGLVAAFDGKKWQLANDPQPGASGGQGSFQPPFADAIAEKFQVPVGIIACGIGATSVREWLPKGTAFPQPPTLEGRVRKLASGEWESKGEAFEMLTTRMKQLGPQGFRAVLWHQGESDAEQPDPKRSLSGAVYREYLEKLIKDSRQAIGWDAPWFVALVSSHGGNGIEDLRAGQKALWADGLALEGPDSDALRGDLRDGVHFSGKGLREHGARWVEKVGPWLERQIKNPNAVPAPEAKATLTLTSPSSHQVFQRDQKNHANILIQGTISSKADTIEAKVDLQSSTLRQAIMEWKVVGTIDPAREGRFSFQVSVPAGGWYQMTIRAKSGGAILAEQTVDKVGVGEVLITAGQSNSANFGNPKQQAKDDRVVYFNGKNFVPAKDPIPGGCGGGGSPWPLLGDRIVASQQVPVCFRSASLNWTEVAAWLPPNTPLYKNLSACAQAFGKDGVRAVLWHQGESDTLVKTSAETYAERIKLIVDALNKDTGYALPWLVAEASFHPGSQAPEQAQVAKGQQLLWAKGICQQGPITDDLLGAEFRHDGVHFNQKGLEKHADRWFEALSVACQWKANATNQP